MKAYAFWKTVTVDAANLLDQFISLLERRSVSGAGVGSRRPRRENACGPRRDVLQGKIWAILDRLV